MLRARSRQSMFAYLAIWLIAPFIPLLHVTSWPLLAGGVRRRDRDRRCSTGSTRVPGASRRGRSWSRTSVLIVLFAQWVGALLMTPLFVVGAGRRAGIAANLVRRPVIVLGWGLVALFLPIALESVGVLPTRSPTARPGLTSWGNIIDSRTDTDLAMVFVGDRRRCMLLTARFALGLTRSRLEAQRHVSHPGVAAPPALAT